MDLEKDLQKIALQEQQLVFGRFDASTAWEIGVQLKLAAERRGAALAIEIALAGQPLFFYMSPGATPNNANWTRRKRNTVLHFRRSSYGFGLEIARDKTDLALKFGLSPSDYAVFGGGFPVSVAGCGVLGAIAVSGLPQREDHGIIVEVLATFLGKRAADLALD